MKNIKIRAIENSDLEKISKIHVDVWNETYRGIIPDKILDQKTYDRSLETWKEFYKPHSTKDFYYLCEVHGELAGFCIATLSPRDDLGFDSELMAINILKKFHNQGIGKALFNACKKSLKNAGARNVYLWVAQKNINAVNFYKHLGGKDLHKTHEEWEGVVEIALGWDF